MKARKPFDPSHVWSCSSIAELTNWLLESISPFGLKTGFVVELAAPGEPLNPTRLYGRGDPEWERAYLAAGCYRHDPAILHIFVSSGFFRLRDLQTGGLSDAQRSVVALGVKHGHVDGLVLPVLGASGRIQAMVMTAPHKLSLIPEDCAYLMLIGTLFVARGREIVPQPRQDRTTLTERERQCLAWASQSKSDWAIGQILGLSPATVHMHIEKARKKLGGHSRYQSAIEAWKLGLLSH